MVTTSWILVVSFVVSTTALTSPASKPSTCSWESTGDVTLKASPSAIYPKLTKALEVNCSLVLGVNSAFQSLMSVILSKEDGGQDKFSDVAVVTSHNPRMAEVKDMRLSGDVTASLSGSQAFLAIRWRNPASDAAGRYRCVAYGMDKDGHPVVSTGYVTVAVEDESIDLVLKRLNEIEAAQSNLKAAVTSCCLNATNLASRINQSETKLAKVTLDLLQTQAKTSGLQRRLDGFRDGMFELSASFQGKVYLLSRFVLTDLANMDLTCRLFGGYLAEIRTEPQFRFIHDLLLTRGNIGTQQVMLGATDEAAEGVWTYLTSGDRISYAAWKDGANGGRGSNCMMFTGTFRGGHAYNGITTDPCKTSQLNKFLCEVPEADLKP